MPNTQPDNLFVKRDKAEGGEEKHLRSECIKWGCKITKQIKTHKYIKSHGGLGEGVSKEDLIHNCSEAMQVKLLLL